jgi:hypothetical protein
MDIAANEQPRGPLTRTHLPALELTGSCLRKHFRHLCTSIYRTQIGSHTITVMLRSRMEISVVTLIDLRHIE